MVKKDFNGESPRKYVHATDVASLIQPPLPPWLNGVQSHCPFSSAWIPDE
jgi:hypothetical protein